MRNWPRICGPLRGLFVPIGKCRRNDGPAIVNRPWHWFAFRPERPSDAFATTPALRADGAQLGFLAAWKVGAGRKPVGALGIDARAVDLHGQPAWISLALAPERLPVPFDDP